MLASTCILAFAVAVTCEKVRSLAGALAVSWDDQQFRARMELGQDGVGRASVDRDDAALGNRPAKPSGSKLKTGGCRDDLATLAPEPAGDTGAGPEPHWIAGGEKHQFPARILFDQGVDVGEGTWPAHDFRALWELGVEAWRGDDDLGVGDALPGVPGRATRIQPRRFR